MAGNKKPSYLVETPNLYIGSGGHYENLRATMIAEEYFKWKKYDVEIKNISGDMIYSEKEMEYPVDWSEQAKKVVSSKYFYRGDEHKEKSLKDLVYRVTDTIAKNGLKQGVFLSEKQAEIFREQLAFMEFSQMHSFNSPVWFNVGLYDHYGVKEKRKEKFSSHWAIDKKDRITNKIDSYQRSQASACFIQSIDDTMESILTHAKKEGMLFKYGSGTGSNFSSLRGVNEPLAGGGVASGSTSFMRIFDIIAGRVQSGGKTRRAAKMVILDANHPDLYRFVQWKINEEKKALWLTSQPQWGPKSPNDLDTEAYKTVDGQNGNNSIRVTDEFMEAAIKGNDWDLWFKTAGRFAAEIEIPLSKYKDDRYLPDKRFIKRLTNKRKTINAGEALEQVARAATVNGDPGLQYHDTINRWHTCPNSGPINASNPCSEYMFIDDTACNLSSLNLLKFSLPREDKKILDVRKFESAVKNAIVSQEILVDSSSYPSKEIAKNSNLFRPLGLGYTNLGALLMSRGIAYDSDEGRAIAATITSLMTAEAYKTSAELAKNLGAFKEFNKNREPMMNVLQMHKESTTEIKNIDKVEGLPELYNHAIKTWKEAIDLGNKYGFRNSQVTLLAPTGTIGFMMDVDCTGVEPMLGLKTLKGRAGGGDLQRSVAPSVESGLKALGYGGSKLEKILDYIDENGSVTGAPELDKEHYKVFSTAFGDDGNAINVDGHLNMMAAVQPFLSGAISKTVNLPKGSTVEDVRETYLKGWKLGLKSISLYIDGSKGMQPVTIDQKIKEKNGFKWGDRKKPSDSDTDSYRKKVTINGMGLHFMIGEYNDRSPKDSPADFFIEFGSSGSEYSAAYTSWGKEASRNRQRGENLEEFIKHNKGARGSINGMTDHPFIRTCSSIEDMFAKIIQLEYLGDASVCDVKPTPEQIENLRCNVLARRRREEHYMSRIKFIENVMEKGEITEIYPLYEDKVKGSEIPMNQEFCKTCGHKTIPSGANCRKCINCGDSGGCG
jgi:ribonucleoside-diphosphate reductase alpha chain